MGATSFHQNEVNWQTNTNYKCVKLQKIQIFHLKVEITNNMPSSLPSKTPIQPVQKFEITIQGPVLRFWCPSAKLQIQSKASQQANAEIPKKMFRFQKLNVSPRILIEPLHLQRAKFQPGPHGNLPVKTSRLVRHPSLCQPDKPPDATGLAQPKNRKTIIWRNFTIVQK